jgi:hypothetical protein
MLSLELDSPEPPRAYGDPAMAKCPMPGCPGRLRWRYRAAGPDPYRPPYQRFISCEMCWYEPPMKAQPC